MKIERIHLLVGLVWLLAGMALGEHMGRTGDHGQLPTHAHIMLVGGVLSIIWAVLYRVFKLAGGLLGYIQLGLHQIGTLVMVTALYLLYGEQGDPERLGPILGISAMLVILSVVLMLYKAIKAPAE
ncbi:MAG: hypothetical protein P8J78_12390 [Maricaulis sp.]|jgi:hypothetical protein|nr:hypothetical protein [Maricaulis sp.]